MTLREAAAHVMDIAKDGIGWIVLWREGRGWNSDYMFPAFDENTCRVSLDEDQVEEAAAILRTDPQAILVNSYYHNLAVWDYSVSLRDLADALRWQYSLGSSMLKDAL